MWIDALAFAAIPLLTGMAIPGSLGAATRWYLGLIALGASMMLFHCLGLPRVLAMSLLVMGMSAAMLLGARRLVRRPSLEEVAQALVLMLVLIAPLANVFFTSVDLPVYQGDALLVWWGKTNGMTAWAPMRALPFPNYPELGPACWMLALKIAGAANESIGRSILGLVYIAWLAAMPRMLGRSWPALLAMAVSLPGVFDRDMIANGYQDGFLTATAGMAAIFLIRILWCLESPIHERLIALRASSDGRTDLVLAGVFCGALGLIKNEGAIIGAILVAMFLLVLVTHTHPRNWRRLIAPLRSFGVAYLLVAATWPVLLLLHGLSPLDVQGPAFTARSVLSAFTALDRWPLIRSNFTYYFDHHRQLVTLAEWSAPAAFILAPRARKAVLFAAGAVMLHLAFVAWVFLSTKQTLAWHLQTAFLRLAFHNTSLLLTLVVVALGALGERAIEGVRRRFDSPPTAR